MLGDLLANNRTMLAYIRTSLAVAGFGFAVAKFGLNAKTHVSGYPGTLTVLVGLLVAIIGFVLHRAVLNEIGPPPGASVSSRDPRRGGHRLHPCLRLLVIYVTANAT